MMTVYFSTLTEYFQQKTVYFLVRPYILQGPYIFKERLFYHIIVCIMVPSHFIPCSLHFWSHFIPKWKNVFTTSHVHLIPGVTSYLESLHTRSHFIQWVTSYLGSLHTGVTSYHCTSYQMHFITSHFILSHFQVHFISSAFHSKSFLTKCTLYQDTWYEANLFQRILRANALHTN